MDILSHTFSGLAIGATAIHFVKKGFISKSLIVLTCGLAAFFPDLDVISHWSGFDSTFGEWFDLKQTGVNIYHQKKWFSHHALFHSLIMAVCFTGLAVIVGIWKRGGREFRKELLQNYVIYIAIFSSYIIHLLEDMPTPDFVWGGVAFLFPSDNYWGGKGYIWWWNNYDLFLIILSVFVLNLLISLIRLKYRLNARRVGVLILIIGITLYFKQMITRPYDFNYTGFSGHHEVWQQNEAKSKKIQKEILGETLFGIMESVDNSIPIWF